MFSPDRESPCRVTPRQGFFISDGKYLTHPLDFLRRIGYLDRMTTTPTAKKIKTPRKSPIAIAIIAGEKAVIRANKRHARSLVRADKMRAKIATIIASGSSFDALVAQLRQNVENLRKVEKTLAGNA